MKKNSKRRRLKKRDAEVSTVALLALICDNVLTDSVRFSSCEIRLMLHDAIDVIRAN